MWVVPADTPVTSPEEFMVAMEVFKDVQDPPVALLSKIVVLPFEHIV